jgi:Domain of unknown function (DUF1735)
MKLLINTVVALTLAVGLTSCLKDDEHFVDFAASGYVAEIPYVANRSILRSFSVSASKPSLDTLIDVNIASPSAPTTDIPITLGVDAGALTAYNATATTKYNLLPATAYTIPNATVTVPAGQRIASVRFSLLGGKVPTTGGPFALPISILVVPTNVTISANYRTQIVVVALTK